MTSTASTGALSVVTESDPARFLACVRPFLAAGRVVHSMLTVTLHFWITGESPDRARVGA